MGSETMVFGAGARRSEKWRVYRIRTANSAYELEVQAEVGAGARRCAVLTCIEPASRNGEVFEDSAPQVGAQSLHAVSPMDWIGQPLTVGTARTSEIQSVDFIATTSARAQRGARQAAEPPPAPRREEPRTWAPYPLGSVEMAEAAASVLQALCHQRNLLHDLGGDPHLTKRLKLALAQCGLMLEALDKRS